MELAGWSGWRPFVDKDIPLIGHVRSMGFDILEIPVWDEPFDVDRVADELRKHQVEASVAAYQTEDRDLTHPDQSVRSKGIQHLKHCVDVASQMGATRIVGPLGAPAHAAYKLRTPDELKRDIDTCAAGLSEAAKYAEDQRRPASLRAAQSLRNQLLQPSPRCRQVGRRSR